MDLPTLDFSKFLRGTPEEKVDFSNRLVDSFKNHGFVKLVNHSVPETLVSQLLQGVRTKNSHHRK